MKEKLILTVACMLGVLCVAYGMIKGNNSVFFLGILIVGGSYLAIRRKLKEALREKPSVEA
jgi:uncharacterized protein YneF (UPF0154 family)